jgi:hypothetical protein
MKTSSILPKLALSFQLFDTKKDVNGLAAIASSNITEGDIATHGIHYLPYHFFPFLGAAIQNDRQAKIKLVIHKKKALR